MGIGGDILFLLVIVTIFMSLIICFVYYHYRKKIMKLTIQQGELEKKIEELIELNTYKDNLFTVVAHDIREPLGLLLSLSELLEEEMEEKKVEELPVFQNVFTKVKNTYMVVEQLLDWYRSQQEKPILHPQMWPLSPIIERVMKYSEMSSESKNIVVTNIVEDHIHVYADREMINFVLRNLICNAIKYTEMGGTICIGASKKSDKVIVFVKDSGIGIAQEIRNSLFQVPQQKSTLGTMNEQGTGLGLYLASKFVQLNGGEIWFESESGIGSTFFFSLPSSKQPLFEMGENVINEDRHY